MQPSAWEGRVFHWVPEVEQNSREKEKKLRFGCEGGFSSPAFFKTLIHPFPVPGPVSSQGLSRPPGHLPVQGSTVMWRLDESKLSRELIAVGVLTGLLHSAALGLLMLLGLLPTPTVVPSSAQDGGHLHITQDAWTMPRAPSCPPFPADPSSSRRSLRLPQTQPLSISPAPSPTSTLSYLSPLHLYRAVDHPA